ncbi:MAG: ATP-grasp domain-containing protein [Deltaproteobacteria bacterium]|nr:ATP-grasp domain-containing protein [Deltaproteobacteria bacterium]
MRIAILYNDDFSHLSPGVNRSSQDAILGVVASFERALAARGAAVFAFPVGADAFGFSDDFLDAAPDLIVNLCESFGGDARGELIVPALLDLLRVPYTGSGPLALALALHKHKAKEILRARGIPTPEWQLIERLDALDKLDVPLPAIVKPAHEDASIGIDRRSLVKTRSELAWACERVLTEHRQPALVERFIDGRELNVGLWGAPPEILPIHEIDFSHLDPAHPHVVTYAAKWDEAAPEYQATHSVPCRLDPQALDRVRQVARGAFEALELRDYGRVDIRLAADGSPYVIEVNPNCDLSLDAGFARAAQAAGIDYESLVWRLVEIAMSRYARPSHDGEGLGAAGPDARGNRRAPAGRGRLRPGAGPARSE